MSNAATESNPLIAQGLEVLDFARRHTMRLIEELSDEQFFTPACARANHAGWCVGHLVTTDDYCLGALAGQAHVCPESWGALFGMNSKPTVGPEGYPSRAELVEAMTERREALRRWLSSLSEAQAREPIEGDLAPFASSRGVLGASLAYHEGFHVGQISVARRAMGFEPLF